MKKEEIFRLVAKVVGESQVYLDEPMWKHTTFRIGGPADFLITPSSVAEITEVCHLLRQISVPYLILGNGSNVLVGDLGIRGAVIQIGKSFSACTVDGDRMEAETGIKLSRLAANALEKNLTGLEFAAGIPGTLGGAIFMNAGAYGGEMKQVIESVTYLDGAGDLQTVEGGQCEFGYRTSIFAEHPEFMILGCRLQLKEGDPIEIRALMDDLAERRTSKQPLNFPSAGSTFKRPQGAFAGKLIQDAGLMGFRIGGAAVSEKHAGFVVNDQNATAQDVRRLIAEVQQRVAEKFDIVLQPEVRFVGEF